MPLKVKRLLFFIFTVACASQVSLAQQNSVLNLSSSNSLVATTPNSQPGVAANANSTADKLVRARALIAVRSFGAAAGELEKIKKEVDEDAVQSVVRVMLVGIYLEQPNYDRAKNLLIETFERNKNRRSSFEAVYLPVAGQVIKSSYSQLERYKKLGLALSDPKLPTEAATDLAKWHKLLETVIEQSKQMSLDEKKSAESLAVLEQAAGARGALARDEYEAAQWRNSMDDTREMIANAQSKVTDVDQTLLEVQNVASSVFASAVVEKAASKEPIKLLGGASSSSSAKNLLSETEAPPAPKKPVVNNSELTAKNDQQSVNKAADQTQIIKVSTKNSLTSGLLQVGSLVDMATRKAPPTYPSAARSARITGVVKVEVVVDETGAVKEVKTADGPEMLRRAATDAIRRWKFKPMLKDGQAVAMSGFVNFNFTL